MYVLGIDIGTSGAKALAVDEGGRISGRGYAPYPVIQAGPGRVEQEPSAWWSALAQAVRGACTGIDTRLVAALSLSTQGASSFLVDASGKPLHNAITWMDTRAGRESAELAEAFGDEIVYRSTGWAASACLDAAKLRWLALNEPSLLERASRFVSTLEYVNYRLVGRYAIDPTNAAARQLLDLGSGTWDPRLVAWTGADPSLLPELMPTGDFLGRLEPEAAEALGLSPQVKVYNGAHDQYCACLGSDTLHPGEIMLSTGTAWVLMAVHDAPLFTASRLSPGPHIVAGLWGILASLPSAGSALEWLRREISDFGYDELNARLLGRRNAAEDLLFLPLLNGGQFPAEDDRPRGAFLGLSLGHDRWTLAAAVMEGVAFQMRLALEEFSSAGIESSRINVTGGALRSPYWKGLVASVVDQEALALADPDSAALGAAAIAGVGAGLWADLGAAVRGMNPGSIIEPWPREERDRLMAKFGRYRAGLEMIDRQYGLEAGAPRQGAKS